jgi:hypothetical protein
LIAEIQLVASSRQHLVKAELREPSHDSRAHETAVAGNENAGVVRDFLQFLSPSF